MDTNQSRKLRQLELLEALPSGVQGVRVSIQYLPRMSKGSRSERRALLEGRFRQIAGGLIGDGGMIEFDTLSVSGQCLEAVVPINHYDQIEHRLREKNIRIDVLIDRQVVD